MKAVLSPLASDVLNNLQWQGDRNDCGPFTTATVINALCHTKLDALELAEQMDKPRWRGIIPIIRRVPNSATFPWGIVDVMRDHGLKASWRALASVEQLHKGIAEGDILMPIIGEWHPPSAHVMTLLTFNEDKGWGFANTQYDSHDLFWVKDEEFQTKWKNMGRLLVWVDRKQRRKG